MPRFGIDQWRLGHKRPWWQWNIITLFVLLFVLIWTRDLLSLPRQASLLLCFGVFLFWFALPWLVGLRYCRRCDAIIPFRKLDLTTRLCPECAAIFRQAEKERARAEHLEQLRREAASSAAQEAVARVDLEGCPIAAED